MSLFNLPVVHKKKEESVHPWAKTIKEYYADRIKRAHNSVRNPVYPKPKPSQRPTQGQVKFTIIGDRLTKEFIYCVHLVKNMHKYRPKSYACPEIKGVTTIEWPSVQCDLWTQYGPYVKCVTSPVIVLYNNQLLGGINELKDLMETKHSLYLALNYKKEIVSQFLNFVKSSGRPCAYMHISIDEKPAGCLIFMLYSDICPKTCDNFLRLCKSRRGGYSGTPVHRIVKDGWIQCGGFGLKDVPMQCENFTVDLDRRGILGMANADRDVDCSTQFFVLLEPQPWMKHKYVAFGQLIEGAETLQKIAAVETFYESPKSEIIIYKAGVLNLDCNDIFINKNANEYIAGHIDDLVAIGDLFYEMLMGYVFLEIEFKYLLTLEAKAEDEEEEKQRNIRATQRFIRKKEDLQRQIGNPSPNRFSTDENREKDKEKEDKQDSLEFDVEEYELKSEASPVAVTPVTVAIEKPKKPFYIPLTDVPYPGEKDSNYDLKRLLRGDYCLQADLNPKLLKKEAKSTKEEKIENLKGMSQFMSRYVIHDTEDDEFILEPDQEKIYQEYLDQYIEIASMSGPIIREIAKQYIKPNPIEKPDDKTRFTDEDVRKIRLAKQDHLLKSKHKVGVTEAPWATHGQVKRRQTGYFSPADMLKFALYDKPQEEAEIEQEEEEESSPKRKAFGFAEDVKRSSTSSSGSVDIDSRHVSSIRFKLEDDADKVARKIQRRPTGFVRPEMLKHLRKFKKQMDDDNEDTDDDEDDDEDDDDDDDDDDDEKLEDVLDHEKTDIHTLPKVLAQLDSTPTGTASAVRLAIPKEHSENKIMRRPTAFVRQTFDDEDDDDDDADGGNYNNGDDEDSPDSPEAKTIEVQEDKTSEKSDEELYVAKPAPLTPSKSKQVQGFVIEKKLSAPKLPQPKFEANENTRVSTLARLYKEVNVTNTEDVPTLKEYKPIAEIKQENILLTASQHFFGPDDDLHYLSRHAIRSPVPKSDSADRILNLQQEKHRISQDYIQLAEPPGKQPAEKFVINKSIRAIEYAKHRPTMSVNQYQQKYLSRAADNTNAVPEKKPDHKKRRSTVAEDDSKPWTRGIRLPGDSPLYASVQSIQKH